MTITEAVYTGRRMLLTDYLPNKMRKGDGDTPVLDENTIPKIIKDVWADVQSNGIETEYLLSYYRGRQDILDRDKVVRPDVDNRVVFNHAMAITRNTVGYTFGKPIRYVHRTDGVRKDVSELNAMVEAEDKFSSDQELAVYASVCGTAYRGIFRDAYGIEDDIPFSITTLDPATTFIVYSTEVGHPPVLACTFYETPPSDTMTNKFVYLVYTHDYSYRFEVQGSGYGVISPSDLKEKVQNPLNEIQIIEYPNNAFRIGDWEIAKSLLDAINVVGSDSVNDLEQFVNSILVAKNVDLDDKAMQSIKDYKMVSLQSDKDLPADLSYISEQLDAGSAQELREYLMEQLRLVVGIPARDGRSGGGGDTGDAVYLRDGFQDLEIVARNKETFFKRGERASLKLIVGILKLSNEISKTLATKDIDIKFSRNMTEGILAKANAISILHSSKVLHPVDTLALVGISTEPDELAGRGEKYWENRDDTAVKEKGETTDIEDEILKTKVDRI